MIKMKCDLYLIENWIGRKAKENLIYLPINKLTGYAAFLLI